METTDSIYHDYSQWQTMRQTSDGFDPISSMIRRKMVANGEIEPELPKVENHNTEDIKELEEFCIKHGILAANFKGMNPKSALEMLKRKIGYIGPTKKQLLNG